MLPVGCMGRGANSHSAKWVLNVTCCSLVNDVNAALIKNNKKLMLTNVMLFFVLTNMNFFKGDSQIHLLWCVKNIRVISKWGICSSFYFLIHVVSYDLNVNIHVDENWGWVTTIDDLSNHYSYFCTRSLLCMLMLKHCMKYLSANDANEVRSAFYGQPCVFMAISLKSV